MCYVQKRFKCPGEGPEIVRLYCYCITTMNGFRELQASLRVGRLLCNSVQINQQQDQNSPTMIESTLMKVCIMKSEKLFKVLIINFTYIAGVQGGESTGSVNLLLMVSLPVTNLSGKFKLSSFS